jgi:hypothetical protein
MAKKHEELEKNVFEIFQTYLTAKEIYDKLDKENAWVKLPELEKHLDNQIYADVLKELKQVRQEKGFLPPEISHLEVYNKMKKVSDDAKKEVYENLYELIKSAKTTTREESVQKAHLYTEMLIHLPPLTDDEEKEMKIPQKLKPVFELVKNYKELESYPIEKLRKNIKDPTVEWLDNTEVDIFFRRTTLEATKNYITAQIANLIEKYSGRKD